MRAWLRRLLASPLLAALWVGDPGCGADAPDPSQAPPAGPSQGAGAAGSAGSAAAGSEAAGAGHEAGSAAAAGAGSAGGAGGAAGQGGSSAGGHALTLAPGKGSTVDYELAWDWTGAERDEASGARVFTTSAGFRVRIEALYIGATGAELVPCSAASAPRRRGPLGVLSPREALADHAVVHDVSAVTGAVAEDALGEAPRGLGSGVASGQPYCQALWTFAPVAEDAPGGFRMQGWSLYVRGSYRRGEGVETPFEAFVGLGQGALRALTWAGPAPAPALDDGARVTLRRRVVAAFDPIDFEALAPVDLAFEALSRLATTAVAEISAR